MATAWPEPAAAMDAVTRCMIRALVVPHVYKAAPWPAESSRAFYLVVIDRAGTGDPHVIALSGRGDPFAAAAALGDVRAAFRWVAFPARESADREAALLRQVELGTPASGRIGLIEIIPMAAGQTGANVLLKATRRPGRYSKLVSDFTARHVPDVSY